MQTIKTAILDVAFEAGGACSGPPILLLHGWPDDIREWSAITGHLEKAGFYWVAPWVRGFGATRFLSSSTLRDGSGVALAQDAIDIADALGFERFSVVGFPRACPQAFRRFGINRAARGSHFPRITAQSGSRISRTLE